MNEAIAEILRDGGGFLPSEGRYTAAVWGRWVGRSEPHIIRHFQKLNVPYVRLGDQCFYDAAEVLERLPRMTFAKDPRRKHGGNRRDS